MPLFGAGGFKPPASAYSATRARYSRYLTTDLLAPLKHVFHFLAIGVRKGYCSGLIFVLLKGAKMGKLDGKSIIITGGAKGQGAAEVRLATDLGAKVMVTDILDEEGVKIAEETGNIYMSLDVTSPEQWADVVAATVEEFGGVDGLINNAGIDQKNHGGVVETPVDLYRTVVEVNQIGTFLGMSAVAPVMIKQNSGSIVNISSVAGMRGLKAIAYVSSKWAVRGMTKTAAAELGSSNIRVNSIHPGAIETDMLFDLGEDSINWLVSKVPMQRSGTPDEVGETAMFLLSDEASYISGAEIVVDGALITR